MHQQSGNQEHSAECCQCGKTATTLNLFRSASFSCIHCFLWILRIVIYSNIIRRCLCTWVEQHLYNGCPTSRYPAADGRYRVRNAAGQFLGLANIVQGVLRVEKLFVERN